MLKDPSAYKKAPVLASVVDPKTRYAVMVEQNRVLRFNNIDPTSKYVVHVTYPHPVEDMFVFYENLNAEPLVYLHPKI